MKLVFLLTGLAVLCSVAAHATLFANPILDSALVHLRAGAKKGSKGNGKERFASTSARDGKKSNKKAGSKYGSSSSKRKNNELTQWNGRGKAKKGPGLRDKLEKIAKQGQSIYKDVYRRAKVLQSSAFEAMLLKATWPSNDPVQPEILGEIVKYSIPAFKFASTESEDDPYYMTLHKLWTKMSEKDWRTVAKSFYILHTIERDCQVTDCQKFGAAIKDMAKTRNPKNPDHRYFEIGKIAELDEAGEEFEPFVRAYASYVIARAKGYSARFEELKNLGEKSSEKQVMGALKKAQQLISLGLQTEVSDKKHINAITGHAIKQVALDLRDLQAQIGEKVSMFVAGGKFAANSTNAAVIAEALKSYLESREKVKGFLSRSAKLFVRLRIKIPTDFDTTVPAPKADAVSARIKELRGLSGGSTSTAPTTSSTTTGVSNKRVLQRADRPLTPQEVRWSVELQARHLQSQLSSSGQSSHSAASISSSGLLQEAMHSYGGASLDEDGEDSQEDGYDDEAEEEDQEDECSADCADSHGECEDDQCDDAACDMDMGEDDDEAESADQDGAEADSAEEDAQLDGDADQEAEDQEDDAVDQDDEAADGEGDADEDAGEDEEDQEEASGDDENADGDDDAQDEEEQDGTAEDIAEAQDADAEVEDLDQDDTEEADDANGDEEEEEDE